MDPLVAQMMADLGSHRREELSTATSGREHRLAASAEAAIRAHEGERRRLAANDRVVGGWYGKLRQIGFHRCLNGIRIDMCIALENFVADPRAEAQTNFGDGQLHRAGHQPASFDQLLPAQEAPVRQHSVRRPQGPRAPSPSRFGTTRFVHAVRVAGPAGVAVPAPDNKAATPRTIPAAPTVEVKLAKKVPKPLATAPSNKTPSSELIYEVIEVTSSSNPDTVKKYRKEHSERDWLVTLAVRAIESVKYHKQTRKYYYQSGSATERALWDAANAVVCEVGTLIDAAEATGSAMASRGDAARTAGMEEAVGAASRGREQEERGTDARWWLFDLGLYIPRALHI